MNQNSDNCQGGWTSNLLLAYLEGDLSQESARDLEAHLQGCPICSRSLRDLRDMDELLKKSHEAFHPESERLWRFAVQAHDPDGIVSRHLADCAQCREDAEIFQDMAAIGSAVPKKPTRLPASLRARLKDLHRGDSSVRSVGGWLPRALEHFRSAFRVPTLAVGTSAALVILLVLSLSVWRHRIQLPDLPEKPSPQQVAHFVRPTEPTRSTPEALRLESPAHPEELVPRSETDKLDITKRQYAHPSKISPVEEEGEKREKDAEVSGVKLKEKIRQGAPLKPFMPHTQRKAAGVPPAPSSAAAEPQKGSLMREAPSQLESTESFQAGSQPRVAVEVRIVDAHGQAISWPTFTPKPGKEGRYRFLERNRIGEAAPTIEGKVRAPQDSETAPSEKELPLAQYVVVVEVRASGDGSFDLRARLLEHGVREMTSVAESGIAKEDLSRRVNASVYKLLGIH